MAELIARATRVSRSDIAALLVWIFVDFTRRCALMVASLLSLLAVAVLSPVAPVSRPLFAAERTARPTRVSKSDIVALFALAFVELAHDCTSLLALRVASLLSLLAVSTVLVLLSLFQNGIWSLPFRGSLGFPNALYTLVIFPDLFPFS